MIHHDCFDDAALTTELSSLYEKLDEARWKAIFLAADMQQDHPLRECKCPLTLSELMTRAVAEEVNVRLVDVLEFLNQFIVDRQLAEGVSNDPE